MKGAGVWLLSTRDRAVAIGSPVKVRILDLAKEGPIQLELVIEKTGKSKSTITKHVSDLESAGLIASRPDVRDRRRRIIELTSERIGELTAPERLHPPLPDRTKLAAAFKARESVAFLRSVHALLRAQAMILGINLDPLFRRIGEMVGESIAEILMDDTTEGLVAKMDTFWRAHGLGRITLAGTDPIAIEVRECFECQELPQTGRSACFFEMGTITSIFSRHLGQPMIAVEQECYSRGDSRCFFLVLPWKPWKEERAASSLA